MTYSIPFVLACIWLVVANVLAMIPSKDSHWRRAYILMSVGIPLLIWLFIVNGPWIALIFLAAGMSVLRWPVIYLTRWVKRQLGQE